MKKLLLFIVFIVFASCGSYNNDVYYNSSYPNGNLNADYVIILEMYENGKQIYRIGGKGKIDLELKEGNISLKSNYILPK